MKTLSKKEKVNHTTKLKTSSTGSDLLDFYSMEDLRDLVNDIVIGSKLKGQNVKDFLLETRTW